MDSSFYQKEIFSNKTKKVQKVIDISDMKPKKCPYLGQINRHVLDFDLEKICSISLQSNFNIWCCLTCGKYFRGKGEQTEAFIHSLDSENKQTSGADGHNVFINLTDAKIFCLPDNYEVKDSSLDDIKANLLPRFRSKQIQEMLS